jgi:hypothetical protein
MIEHVLEPQLGAETLLLTSIVYESKHGKTPMSIEWDMCFACSRKPFQVMWPRTWMHSSIIGREWRVGNHSSYSFIRVPNFLFPVTSFVQGSFWWLLLYTSTRRKSVSVRWVDWKLNLLFNTVTTHLLPFQKLAPDTSCSQESKLQFFILNRPPHDSHIFLLSAWSHLLLPCYRNSNISSFPSFLIIKRMLEFICRDEVA